MSISVTGTTASGSDIDIGKAASKKDNVNFQDTTDNQGRANFVIDVPRNIKKMKIRVSIFITKKKICHCELFLQGLNPQANISQR